LKIKAHIPIIILAITSLVLIEGCKAKKNKLSANSSGNLEEYGQFANYFIDACTHANTGNYETALKLFNKCKELKPTEASVFYEMSRVYQKTRENTLALQYAMKAYEYAPTNKYYAIHYADRLKANNQFDEAITVLNKIYTDNKKDELIVKKLDSLYKYKNETAKRIALWNSYQSAGGYKLGTSLKLIELYQSIKDYKSAHQVYDQIKKASPAKYQYFIDDANLYLEQNDEINANINFEKALQINPNNWKLNYALYKSYRKKNDRTKAGFYLQQAFADVNTGFESKTNVCVELNNEFKTDSSIRFYTLIAAGELVRLYSENANAMLTAAGFYEQNNKLTDALAAYQKAYHLNPNVFDAWLGAINCSENLGLLQNMVSISEQALEYYPNVASLYVSSAKGYNGLKNYRKALEQCLAGKTYALDNETKYMILRQEAYAYLNLKDYIEAEKSYNAALAINNTQKELYDEIGNVKYFLNKTEEAVTNWKKAKEMGLKNNTIDKKINDRKFYE